MAGLQTDSAIPAGLGEEKRHEYENEKGHSGEFITTESHDEHISDGIHDGLEFPTDEERQTLRRVSDTIPWNAYRRCIVFFNMVAVKQLFSHRSRRVGGTLFGKLP